jgi:hypothetical protein
MELQERDVFGKWALGFMVLGMVAYVVLDSGLLRGWRENRAKPNPVEDRVVALRGELKELDQETLRKSQEIEDLTSRLARIRLEIQNQRAELGPPSGKSRTTSGRASRQPAMMPKFSKVEDLERFLTAENASGYLFQSGTEPDGGTYQHATMHEPFFEQSPYLRRAGIRWANAVSKAAKDLQAKSLVVRYVDGEQRQERARVIQNYLGELSGSETAIELESVDPETIAGRSQIDLLIRFATATR